MDYANFPGFGNSTSNSLQRYSSLSTITWKLIAFEGLLYSCRIPSTPFTSETVVKLSPDSFLDLCNYDREIVLTDRMNFLRDFALPNNSTLAKCLLALDQNKTVKGYGVLRLCSDYYTIAPVYADNNDIAMALLTGLCRLVPEGSRLHIPFHAECNSTLGLCHQLCFIQCTSEVRTYRSDAFAALGRQLDLNRVYAIQEYWPL